MKTITTRGGGGRVSCIAAPFFIKALSFTGQVVVDPMVQELKDKQLRIKGRFSEDSAESILKSNGAVKAVQMDQNGLVVPRKLHNPCLESRECQDLNREIRWNAKA